MTHSKFDLIMDYIDENIQKDFEDIKAGIIKLIGINSNTFGHYFTVLTGNTLGGYIRSRKLYFAAIALIRDKDRSISDIALDFGYSDQSAFTRAFSSAYDMSPGEFRSHKFITFPNEKYHYSDFSDESHNSRSDYIWREFERTGFITESNADYFEMILRANEEFGFDIDTCCAIADLSEKLSLPASVLLKTCFDLVQELQSDPNYISPDELVALDLGLHSFEDLKEICDHYACRYYELNTFMVQEYYRAKQ